MKRWLGVALGCSGLAIALACAGAAAVIVLWLLLPKGWRIALAAVLLAGTALFTAAEIPIVRASRGTPEEDADYLIVLGAGVNGSVPSLSMANRLTAALAWLEAHPDSRPGRPPAK